MVKIPSVFQRNFDSDKLLRDEVTPGCEWVLDGGGRATVKWDGTSCLVRDDKLYKRYDAKHGKTPPEGWSPCEDQPDAKTGHWPGWLLVGEGPEDRWHWELWCSLGYTPASGTYELVGPKIQGNPHNFDKHYLLLHGGTEFNEEPPRDFEGLRDWFTRHICEGVVWHHPDGRMAKVKRRDFGLPWPLTTTSVAR